MKKLTSGPNRAMTSPPTAGPSARIRLNAIEIIAVAFISASRGTVFAVRTCRTGLFAAHSSPNVSAKA